MLWLLLCLLPPLSHGSIFTQNAAHTERHSHEAAGGTTATPHIYFCRSPNMEDFTCWWHPLSNLTEGEEVTHILTYSKETEAKHECPDYMSGGPNSCHFDSSHTSIWTVYCMTVTAITTRRNYSSQQHCVDVAEIVQTETPVNLTYDLTDGAEMGQNVLMSWSYPEPAHVQYGWITLVYELQYRRVTEPDSWKVKHPLREPQLELLGLPVDDYVVRVRSRAQHSILWSDWSSTLLMSIPPRPSAGASAGRWQDGKLLLLSLVTATGVVALLVITCSLLLQSKRIKEYFLPLLLKKGNLDRINRHFSNFHSYKPHKLTSSSEESCDHVSTSDISVTVPTDSSEPTESDVDTGKVPRDPVPSEVSAHHQLTAPNPTSYLQRVPPHRSLPTDAFGPSPNLPSPWPMLKVLSLPVTEHPGLPDAVPTPELTSSTSHSPQDIYACIQLLYERGEVHLVPCCRGSPPPPTEEEDKKKKATGHQTRKNDGGEAAVPLLPVAPGNSS